MRNFATLPTFYALGGAIFTKQFGGRSKIICFKLLSKAENVDLMSSMDSDHADIEKETHFMLYIN